MAELKTKLNDANVEAFLNSVADEKRRADGLVVFKLMKKITKQEPKMWGASIVGFGTYKYTGASGRSGEWFRLGLSPRKNELTLYIMPAVEMFPAQTANLGKYKTGKSCLYIRKLEDVDMKALEELIRASVAYMKKKHG